MMIYTKGNDIPVYIRLKGLGIEAEKMGEEFMKIMKELKGQGKAMAFPPGVQPPSSKSKS